MANDGQSYILRIHTIRNLFMLVLRITLHDLQVGHYEEKCNVYIYKKGRDGGLLLFILVILNFRWRVLFQDLIHFIRILCG